MNNNAGCLAIFRLGIPSKFSAFPASHFPKNPRLLSCQFKPDLTQISKGPGMKMKKKRTWQVFFFQIISVFISCKIPGFSFF